MISKFILIVFFITLVCLGCSEKQVVGGEITIRNDILDKEYNEFTVDQIVTVKGLASYKKLLKPNEEVKLPFRFISQMRFIRRYSDHSKVYYVSCEPDSGAVLTIKLIDVHTNKLGGGCRLNKRGQMSKGGFIKWE